MDELLIQSLATCLAAAALIGYWGREGGWFGSAACAWTLVCCLAIAVGEGAARQRTYALGMAENEIAAVQLLRKAPAYGLPFNGNFFGRMYRFGLRVSPSMDLHVQIHDMGWGQGRLTALWTVSNGIATPATSYLVPWYRLRLPHVLMAWAMIGQVFVAGVWHAGTRPGFPFAGAVGVALLTVALFAYLPAKLW